MHENHGGCIQYVINLTKQTQYQEAEMEEKKLTMEETENVSGGFDFGLDYRIRKREANIKCPVCGAEGKLATQYTGYEGNADGSYTATDECVCTNAVH